MCCNPIFFFYIESALKNYTCVDISIKIYTFRINFIEVHFYHYFMSQNCTFTRA
uniref:Uncharacterized protein n=1 Tax=Arundo donax TaxID=35708 RepID=A0A0A9GVP5_ARUDO